LVKIDACNFELSW